MDAIINDVLDLLRSVFLGGDYVRLGIAFGSVLIAALMMRRTSQLGSMTAIALILFVIGGFVRAVMAANDGVVSVGSLASAQLESTWRSFMSLQAGVLLAYFLAFMLVLLILYGMKSVFSR